MKKLIVAVFFSVVISLTGCVGGANIAPRINYVTCYTYCISDFLIESRDNSGYYERYSGDVLILNPGVELDLDDQLIISSHIVRSTEEYDNIISLQDKIYSEKLGSYYVKEVVFELSGETYFLPVGGILNAQNLDALREWAEAQDGVAVFHTR